MSRLFREQVDAPAPFIFPTSSFFPFSRRFVLMRVPLFACFPVLPGLFALIVPGEKERSRSLSLHGPIVLCIERVPSSNDFNDFSLFPLLVTAGQRQYGQNVACVTSAATAQEGGATHCADNWARNRRLRKSEAKVRKMKGGNENKHHNEMTRRMTRLQIHRKFNRVHAKH